VSQPKVTIIGLGVIGSSIGLGLQKAEPDFKIIGHDRDSSVSKKAQKVGAVQKSEGNLISAIEDAELVVIATPAATIREIFDATAPYLTPNCVLTDTSTVKEDVLRWADQLLPDTVHFVGGHPVVGPDEVDAEAATADLFAGATYCIVPSARAHPAAIELVTSMARTLGAVPFFLDAAEHDGQVAGVEHLPLILPTALLMTSTQAPSRRDLSRLSGPAFWRATELPSTDPEANRAVFLANSENISRWIDQYIDSLRELQEKLATADAETWDELFAALVDTRARWMAGKGTPEEEAAAEAMEDFKGMRSLGSMFGLTQFRELRDKLERQR